MSSSPQILFIGGHDPTGGAGLQADIETASSHGCRAYTLVTCLTAQDSRNIHAVYPQTERALLVQLECLLGDVQPDMVKLGLLGEAALARVLAAALKGLPLVIDPILAAGGGKDLADQSLVDVVRADLLPRATLATPNRAEARRLTGLEDPRQAAQALLQAGCGRVLLTGADETESGTVVNLLVGPEGQREFAHPLLPHRYHGSGCTLAGACACNLALGMPMEAAVERALDWTWTTLQRADHPGKGQYLPDRRGPMT
jgi:hydroxymethylpyrimidine/phosphomethylpyrimidine kinase